MSTYRWACSPGQVWLKPVIPGCTARHPVSDPARKDGPGSPYTSPPPARAWDAATFPAGRSCESRLCNFGRRKSYGSRPWRLPARPTAVRGRLTYRAVQTSMAVRFTTDGWSSARSPERPAAVRADECGARAVARGGHAGGAGACLGVLGRACTCCTPLGVLALSKVSVGTTGFRAGSSPAGFAEHPAEARCSSLRSSCCHAWSKLGCRTPPSKQAVWGWPAGSTPAGHRLKSRLLFCWPPGT